MKRNAVICRLQKNKKKHATENRKQIKCLTWDILLLHEKYELFNLMASAHLKKVGAGLCFLLCCAASPLLLTSVCKHLGTEVTSCRTFGRGMLSHTCLILDSSCSAVPSLLCCVFGWWKLWIAGGSVQHPDSSTTKPRCGAACGLTLFAETCKDFPDEDVIWMGADVASKPVYTF